MPAVSIRARRQRRKSGTRATHSTKPPQRTQKPRKAPPPPYPKEDRKLARAASVLAHSRTGGMQRYLLFVLALLAEDDNTVSLSNADVAYFLATGDRQTTYHIQALLRTGELVVERPALHHSPRVYRIVPAVL